MSRYDFDAVIDRSGTNSLKWDVSHPDELPLWVADMDFLSCPAVTDAILKRTERGIFGYSIVPKEWHEAYQNWWHGHYGFRPEADSLVFCTGVVPALSSMVRKLTTPAEKVLIQTPVYNIFFNSILNQGRFVIESPLDYRDGRYFINFERLEKDLSDPQCTMMFLCNPHNPAGRIWTREELAEIGRLCAKHGVIVVSDEIHCDLTAPGTSYIPFASVNSECAGNSVTCWSPGKTFNMAGLNSAAVMIPNPKLRYKVERGLNTDECAEPNAFAVQAAIAAYTEGDEWLQELRAYLQGNREFTVKYLKENLPEIYPVPQDATYLMWLDVSAFTDDSRRLCGFLKDEHHLWLSHGSQFGSGGEHFVRLNTACPGKILEEALARLTAGCLNFRQRR